LTINRLHTITVTGKTVSKQFYDREHTKSYFFGCSQGGRQGVGAAEKYPTDFDGIVAGAPALDFNSLVAWRAHFVTLTGTVDSPDFIKPEVWKNVIHPEILKQCDDIDGAKDGIIESPERCKFNVATLICRDGNTQNCITLNQSYRVYAVFHDYKQPAPSNELIYPGMNYGGEVRATERLLSGKPFSDSVDWFRYVVRKDPNFDPLKFSTDDAAASRDLNPSNIKTYPSDLPNFRSRQGKLLIYHGMQDQQITSYNTARWYDQLSSSTNMSPDQLDSWVRYFRISGMSHCSGGPGAWMIGQGYAGAKGGMDPNMNVLAAIVAWVEQGMAPESIEGTKLKDDGTLAFTRKHCKYPKRNQFKVGAIVKDAGITDANDWECV
jgi:feruloyl esterase